MSDECFDDDMSYDASDDDPTAIEVSDDVRQRLVFMATLDWQDAVEPRRYI